MPHINFKLTAGDTKLVGKIVNRAVKLYKEHKVQCTKLDIHMDIAAVHLNDMPLDLDRLMNVFDDFNFMHDITGINKHLNRTTGKLMHCFVPRCAAHSKAQKVSLK